MAIRHSIQTRAAAYGVKIVEDGGSYHVVSLQGSMKYTSGPTAMDALDESISKHGLQLVSMKGRARKAAADNPAGKQKTPVNNPLKRAAPKKPGVKKAAAKKVANKKPAANKNAGKKPAAKKTAPKKTVGKKTVARSPLGKPAGKKPAATKSRRK